MPTIMDVAREAGVGIGTVSRVINGNPLVSEATRQRVLAVIERLGYQPSPIARAFGRRRTDKLEVLVPMFAQSFVLEILQGVEDALDAGRHAESWNDAAAVMKEGRNQQEWIRDIASPRESLGKSIMRELRQAEFSTAVRGGPSGKYVTLVYLTQFAKAPPASETILLTLEDDHWRIAGYSIERAPETTAPAPSADKPGSSAEPKPER